MKKIVDKTGNFDGKSIMTSAKSCLEKQKLLRLVRPRNIALVILLFTILIFVSVFASPIMALVNFTSLCSILISSRNLKTSAKQALKVISSNIAWMANGFEGLEKTFMEDVEVEIVPKNMYVRDDLEALNIVPIFKDGHYVIIKSTDHPVFIRVFEDEGKEEAYVMEPTDEDIETLENDLPEYQEYIKALRLQKSVPQLLQ